jgi:hypothetical protein
VPLSGLVEDRWRDRFGAAEIDRLHTAAAAITAGLSTDGVPTRELPRHSGVSKQAISAALGVLAKQRLAVEGPIEPGSRTKIVHLSAEGLRAKDEYRQRLSDIEADWRTRFGADVDELPAALAALAGPPLVAPDPGGWRATVRTPDTLPHSPMVLHRGGFPDGA